MTKPAPRVRNSIGFELLVLAILVIMAAVPVGGAFACALVSSEAWREVASQFPRIRGLWLASIGQAFAVAAIAVPPGAILGLTLFRVRWRFGQAGRFLVLLSASTPLVLFVGGWQSWFGPYGLFGPDFAAWTLANGQWATILIHALAAIPWTALFIGASSTFVNRAVEEAALLELPASAVLLRVTLKELRPTLATAALLAMIPILTDMTVTDLFRVRSIAEEVYQQNQAEAGGEAIAVLAGLPLVLATTIVAVIAARSAIPNRMLYSAPAQPLSRAPMTFTIPAAFLLAMLLLPAAGFFRQLGLVTRTVDSSTLVTWSISTAFRILLREAHAAWSPILVSLLGALGVGVLSTLCAAILAWRWKTGSPGVRLVGVFLACLLLVLPGPVVAFSILEIDRLTAGRLYALGSLWGYGRLVFGLSVRALPYAFFTLASSLVHLSEDEIAAARMEGAREGSILWRIALGQVPLGFAVAVLVAAAFVFAELPVTIILRPPGFDPLSVQIFSLMHVGTANQQAALCLLLLATDIVLAILLFHTFRRWMTVSRGTRDA